MHESVMLKEAIKALNIKEDGTYIDATLGRAGHAREIDKRLTSGRLIAFDKDLDAISASKKILSKQTTIVHDSFANIERVLDEMNIDKVDGLLFDLGVSSPQFDNEDRGFSYRFDARLDMRMDQTQDLSAYEVVNEYSEERLIEILKVYSDERYAKGIVKNIIQNRPVETTFELVECIKKAYPYRELRKGHPGKKTFQAIRMEVNNELGDIEKALQAAINRVKVGGRIAVITFHSVEDRLVKNIFAKEATPPKVNPRIPIPIEEDIHFKWIHRNKKPSKKEIEINNRAHSAILRVIERMNEDG